MSEVITTMVPTADALADKLLEPYQVARRLNVTTRTVRRWCASGECPSTRIGGRWRVPESWVSDTLRTRRIQRAWSAPTPTDPEVVYRGRRSGHTGRE